MKDINTSLVRSESELMTVIDLLKAGHVLTVPEHATPEQFVKFQTDVIKVLVRELKHVTVTFSEKDNELRSYFRKNLPRNPTGARPEEVELIYAEQRFIQAAKNCAGLISTLSSDKVVEFKSALGTLEQVQAKFKDMLKIE